MTVSVAYHSDDYRPARPAVNVKVHVPGADYWPDVFRSVPPIAPDGLIGDYEPLVEEAHDRIRARFWQDAQGMADSLGLGPIEQEGRSGGWLVLVGAGDPALMDCPNAGEDHFCDPCDAFESQRADWLAAYRLLFTWCADQVREAPARVAALAQQLAMDEIGVEPARRMFAFDIAAEGPHYEPEGVPA
jgi:hypothetical protein